MLWDEPNIELKCQSVRRDMRFLASNSLSTTDHAHVIIQDLQQIHRNKIFCSMYGLGVMLDIARPTVHLSIQIVV